MMDEKIIKLLRDVKRGKVPVEKAYDMLKDIPFEDLNHTKIDFHRTV